MALPAHLLVMTAVSPRPAHSPSGTAGMDCGIPPLSPRCPLGRDGHNQGTSLTLAWHLVWQESLQPAGGEQREG